MPEASPNVWDTWLAGVAQGIPFKYPATGEESESDSEEQEADIPLDQLYPWLKNVDDVPFSLKENASGSEGLSKTGQEDG